MKKLVTYSCITLILFSCLELSAQRKLGSAYSQIPAYPLLDSANYYLKSDPALAFDFVLQVMDRAIKGKDGNAQGECYLVIGNINYVVEQYDLAVDNFSKALKIFQESEQTEKVFEIEGLLGKAYEANNELDKSESYYQSNAITAANTADTRKVRSSKRNLSRVYQKRGEENKAIMELEELRQMDISEGNIPEQLLTNQQLIEAYTANQPQKALDLSDENESMASFSEDTIALLNTLQGRAAIYGQLGRSDDKIATLQQVIDVRKQQNDLAGQSDDNLAISEVLLEQENISDAIDFLEASIELSEKSGKIETRKEALKSLSSAYEKTGNVTLAYSTYKDYVVATEKSALEREQKILANLELMQSLTKRLQRIDMLENQQQLDDRTIEILMQERFITENSLKQQRLIISSLIFGILALLIASVFIFRSSQQKRVANQLLALRSLRSQMNPHFIFNALNSVNSYISKSDDRSANKYLTEFSKLMRAVMENSKSDFVALSSEVQILERYIKLEHHRFTDKFDYTFSIDSEIDQDNIQIPPMLIQPYIENAVWHGLRYKDEKGYLKVEMQQGENLKIIIEDNGIGRKKSLEIKTKNQQESNSTGMKNIDSRLDIINRLHKIKIQVAIEDLDHSDHSGTRVTIDIIQQP